MNRSQDGGESKRGQRREAEGQQRADATSDDEQQRFGGQVRNTAQGRGIGEGTSNRVVPESRLPIDRDRDIDRDADPNWDGNQSIADQEYQSAADTDPDANIERGV